MIADGLAMASPYTRPNANPTGTPQATPTIAGRFRLIPARRGQAMPDPLPNPPWGHPLSCRSCRHGQRDDWSLVGTPHAASAAPLSG